VTSTAPRDVSIQQVRAAFAAHGITLVPYPLHKRPPFDAAHGYTWLHAHEAQSITVVVLAQASLTRPSLPGAAEHEWLANVGVSWYSTEGGERAQAALRDLDGSG
jgi:hypothetical protein